MTGSSQNHLLLDALREKAEAHPELQALIYNVQHGTHKGRENRPAPKAPLPRDSLRSLGLILVDSDSLPSFSPSENGYASTDEEVSEFSEGR